MRLKRVIFDFIGHQRSMRIKSMLPVRKSSLSPFTMPGILSHNGNKTITTGGGGMILTDDEAFARRARHITTTAKLPHRWEYAHDAAGYNDRLPNVNAAIGVAQMEKLPEYLKNKRETAEKYRRFCLEHGLSLDRKSVV